MQYFAKWVYEYINLQMNLIPYQIWSRQLPSAISHSGIAVHFDSLLMHSWLLQAKVQLKLKVTVSHNDCLLWANPLPNNLHVSRVAEQSYDK